MGFNMLTRLDDALFRILKFLTGLTFAAVISSVVLGIFFRYALKSPLPWVEEFSRLNFIWTTFMGACVATRGREHLCIRIFFDGLGPSGKAMHDLVTALFSLVFLGVVLWYVPIVYEALSMQNYAGMPLSQKWQVVPVAAGAAVMALYFVAIIVESLKPILAKDRTA